MDYLSLIRTPIESEFQQFIALFEKSLEHSDGLLSMALDHIKSKSGKRMRPMLVLLMAKNYGKISQVTLNAAVGLELLHTASLVHDDVVDDSMERRGQASVNSDYGNKVAVLVGDYILSTALLHVSYTHSERIVRYLSELGQTLSNGEIMQLRSIDAHDLSEKVYFNIIRHKTASLFEACTSIGAASVGVVEDGIEEAKLFGRNLGIIFQIRDDIFDYYDSKEVGKPTGNDMAEGKLTLPAIYAINSTGNEEMRQIAFNVKDHNVSQADIDRLVEFTKENHGIDYAEKVMYDYRQRCQDFIKNNVVDSGVGDALKAYIDYMIERDK